MTMGKGGVGKTIAASAIAVLLAKKGFENFYNSKHIKKFFLEKLNFNDGVKSKNQFF